MIYYDDSFGNMKVKIKYHGKERTIELIDGKSDWFDLRARLVYKVDTQNLISDCVLSTDNKDMLPLLERKSTSDLLPFERGLLFQEGSEEEVRFVRYRQGDYLKIDLGVSMELPKGYEAYIVPRGSTFKNYGLIQPNSPGVVDESYKGDTDIFFMPGYALQDGFIIEGERVCQFRIQKKMDPFDFEKVDSLNNKKRDSFGSTGTK